MNSTPQEHWETLGTLAQEIMEKKEVPGVALGLSYQGETLTRGLGVTNVEQPLPVTGETLFQVGSITKTFTGTLIMRLVEGGKLALDAPVCKYLPEFQVADPDVSQDVTVRHLLTHTSGWAGDHFVDTGQGADAFQRYMESMAELPQVSPLGAHFSYNNAGFYLAGHLIEKVAGQSYEKLLRETILGPLGMEQAYLYAGEVLTHPFIVGHQNRDTGPQVARPWELPRAVQPVGGLITNAATLLRYARFQMGDGSTPDGVQILAKESLDAMHLPRVDIRPGESWGLSWKIWEADDTRLINHGGGTLGQITNLIIAPQQEFAFTVLTNADRGTFVTNELTRKAVKLYLGVELPQPEPVEADPKELALYVGRYERPYAEIELGVLGGRLIGQVVYKGGFPTKDSPPAPPPPPMTLAPCGKDQLIVLDGPFKDNILDLVRRSDRSIGWLRLSLRLHARQD